jgi:hypothetical protein
MAVCSNLLLLVLATAWLAQAFPPVSEQQRLNQGESWRPRTLGDASFKEFVEQVMHTLHVPGLSLAIIENGQISAEVMLGRLVG